MGYTSGTDFQWDKAWELTDKLGITAGQYGAASAFTRGDAVLVSANALDKKLKDGSKTLLAAIEEALANAPEVPEPSGEMPIHTFTHSGSAWDDGYYPAPMGYEDGKHTVTVDVISKYEAVFTFNTPYAELDWCWYEARFVQSWMEAGWTKSNDVMFSFFSYMEGEEFVAYALFAGSMGWEPLGAVFSEQTRTGDSVSCRVKLPEHGSVDFEMLKEYEFTGYTACNYS